MITRNRYGFTVLELCVALMLVGLLSALAALQFARGVASPPAGESLRRSMRGARTSALRSGRLVSGATWQDGIWIEYTALPTGKVLIDTASSRVVSEQPDSRAGSADFH